MMSLVLFSTSTFTSFITLLTIEPFPLTDAHDTYYGWGKNLLISILTVITTLIASWVKKKAYVKRIQDVDKRIARLEKFIGKLDYHTRLASTERRDSYDKFIEETSLDIEFFDGRNITFNLISSTFDEVLENSDFISVHIPASDKYIIDSKEIEKMKDGVGLLNLSRGGIVNEEELLKSINSGKVSFAGIDTFENEPVPSMKLLMNSNISLTPHIGAATSEAQDRIGVELADKINKILS